MMQRRIEEGNERISKILGEGKVVTDSVAAPIACSFIRRVLKALDIA
ncbi:MAG: hypothetical protein LBF15_00710 [Candidatus Peribacteria bacterium]|jgi:hypothetical protein|nr:hypothetical protein [Candidatus Peribacteria bacterium]